ncbi:MAG: diguanylate cyclase [Bacillota bacterium]
MSAPLEGLSLSLVLDALPVGIMLADQELQLIYLNAAMRKMLGLPESKESPTIGTHIREIPGLEQLGQDIGLSLGFSEVLVAPGGQSTRYLHAQSIPLLSNNTIIGGLIVVTDVTEERQAKQRAQELESLQRCVLTVMHCLLTQEDSQHLLDKGCATLGSARGYTFTWLGLLEGEGKKLRVVSCSGDQPPEWPKADTELVQTAMAQKRTVTMTLGGDQAPSTCAAVPLMHGGNVKGVLCVVSPGAKAFGRQEIYLLEMLGSALAYTIHNMNTAQALHASQHHYRTLVDTLGEGVVLASSSLTIEYANPAFCHLVECNEETLVGKDLKQLVDPGDLHKLTDQIEPDGRIRASSVELKIKTSTGSSRPVRATFTEMAEPANPDPKVLGIFVNISELKQLHEQLKKLAITDSLTGVYNRTYFNERIREEVARARRYGHPLGFLMIDIDDFKRINDEFSHMEGDEVLRDVAKHLLACTRQSDILFRYGGDEFLVLLPETDQQYAAGIMQRIEREIAALSERRRKWGKAPVSVSMGFASWKPGTRKWEDALRESDANMYRAKWHKKTAFISPSRTYATE